MKKQASNASRKKTDPFDLFKETTRRSFAFLQTKYSCRVSRTITQPPECSISYRNTTTGVTISYEWGNIPSVVLTQLEQGKSAWDGEQVGLKFLVMERCPSALYLFNDANGGDNLVELLNAYAQTLDQCGQDVLTGDFTIFPKLRELIIAEQKKINLKVFGSETGETVPR